MSSLENNYSGSATAEKCSAALVASLQMQLCSDAFPEEKKMRKTIVSKCNIIFSSLLNSNKTSLKVETKTYNTTYVELIRPNTFRI